MGGTVNERRWYVKAIRVAVAWLTRTPLTKWKEYISRLRKYYDTASFTCVDIRYASGELMAIARDVITPAILGNEELCVPWSLQKYTRKLALTKRYILMAHKGMIKNRNRKKLMVKYVVFNFSPLPNVR